MGRHFDLRGGAFIDGGRQMTMDHEPNFPSSTRKTPTFKDLIQNAKMKFFIFAIAAMGVVRFALTVAGVPDGIVKYYSMTAIIMAGTFYFAIACKTHKERLKAAYLLILPYMTIEVLALGYTWVSGRQTIFHSADYSFGTPIAQHTIGHFVGGLTWEPLSIFVLMEIVWAIYIGGRSFLRPRTT